MVVTNPLFSRKLFTCISPTCPSPVSEQEISLFSIVYYISLSVCEEKYLIS
jgi:hypothetical protein